MTRVLEWALALSWTPFAATVLVALLVRNLPIALFTSFVLVLWVLKLCEMHGIITRG